MKRTKNILYSLLITTSLLFSSNTKAELIQPLIIENNSVENHSIALKEITSTINVVTPKNKIKERTGLISWYGNSFHNKRAADGSIFNQNRLTTAHMYLKFGTKVKMTCLSTGKSVVVTVTDRGNFAKYGRAFDVSKEAARQLGFLEQGVTKIKYTILE